MVRILLAALIAVMAASVHAPASAQQSCAQIVPACPDGGGRPSGQWPFCGCKRPNSCPLRNHLYQCRGWTDSFGGESGISCACLDAVPNRPPPPPKDFCKRMLTADDQPCRTARDGTCDCSSSSNSSRRGKPHLRPTTQR